MSMSSRRIRALAYLLVLFPLWWMQRTQAHPSATSNGHPASHGQHGDGGGDRALPDDEEGCTLTQGYWKTHSRYADNPSQQIPWPISEDTDLCGETWYDILQTNPSGGITWISLAHQWIAARLNEASGASIDDLNGALDEAGDLLAGNCGGIPDDLEDDAHRLQKTLADFNEGDIGPGHCDDGGGEFADCNQNGIDDLIDIANGTSQDADHDGVPDECQPGVTEECIGSGTANGGVDCPCGNTLPPGSPVGCANRTGQGASLTAVGVPSVSNDTLVLTANGMPPGTHGYFFAGATSGTGRPFGNGTRCLEEPVVNLRKIRQIPGGVSFPPPGTPPISVVLNLTAGTTNFFQVFYRDRGGPCGSSVNSTNSLRVVWGL